MPSTRAAVILLTSIALAACHRGAAPAGAATKAPPSSSAAASSSSGGALTDANIAAVVIQGDNNDILYGSLALAKSTNDAIRKFAQTTVNDHRAVNQAATDLAGKLGLTPEESVLSLDMRDDAEGKRDEMRELSGAAFDKSYIENEVRYHTKMLDIIDSRLLPVVRNPDLRALISNVRPAVQAHLEHAKSLAATFAK